MAPVGQSAFSMLSRQGGAGKNPNGGVPQQGMTWAGSFGEGLLGASCAFCPISNPLAIDEAAVVEQLFLSPPLLKASLAGNGFIFVL